MSKYPALPLIGFDGDICWALEHNYPEPDNYVEPWDREETGTQVKQDEEEPV